MTYFIYYIPENSDKNHRGYTLFDIEYYQKESEIKDGWYSEIHCLPIVEGIVHFIKDSFNNKDFDYAQFIKDANEIQEIRGLLYECYDNKPKTLKDSSIFHYHVFGKAIEKIFNNFAEKYKLHINMD